MIRHLPPALLLAAATALGQETTIAIDPPSPDIVEAKKVELGPIGRFVENAYKYVTPGEPVPNYPGFAYPMTEVLSNRSCDSFGNAPLENDIAFVSPIDQSEDTSQFLGVRASTRSKFYELCSAIKESPPALAKRLDNLMFSVEADPAVLESEGYGLVKARPHDIAKLRTGCARPFITSTTPTTLSSEALDGSTVNAALRQDIPWKSIEGFAAMDADLDTAFRRARGDPGIWMVKPRNRGKLAGRIFITTTPVSSPATAVLRHHDAARPHKLTVWYAPPFCKTKTPIWYLTSTRPLNELEPDFRSKIMSAYHIQANQTP